GNDYVYLDCTESVPENLPELAKKVSNRDYSIGSDGLICICASYVADFRMRMFNADGSEGEMCGNGIRCVGKFVYDKGLTRHKTITVETGAGIKMLMLHVVDGSVQSVTVDMGKPVTTPVCTISVKGEDYDVLPVSMGNPHIVLFLKDIDSLDLPEIGPVFENHPQFPDRTNTEFVEVLSPTHLKMRVWERGSGETRACGTGACATLVAAALSGHSARAATVSL
ncbi:MAG: diaminopimelate epimerase, partial [Alistipes sp.]